MLQLISETKWLLWTWTNKSESHDCFRFRRRLLHTLSIQAPGMDITGLHYSTCLWKTTAHTFISSFTPQSFVRCCTGKKIIKVLVSYEFPVQLSLLSEFCYYFAIGHYVVSDRLQLLACFYTSRSVCNGQPCHIQRCVMWRLIRKLSLIKR